MKIFYKIIILFIILSLPCEIQTQKHLTINNFEYSIYQSIFQTNFQEGQVKEKNIQNAMFAGFEYFYKNSYDQENYFLVQLHQLILYNFQFLEDKEILRIHKQESHKIYLYHLNSSFISVYYKNIFLLLGYINPYRSIIQNHSEERLIFKKISVYPSLDLRLELENHIFTFSPFFLYNKEQKFVFYNEEKDLALIHYFKKENFSLEINQHNLNHKIHYTFISRWFDMYLNYYYVFQENLYLNQKNFLDLNFYDYHLVYKINPLIIRFQISQSLGTFSKDKYFYKIKGNRFYVYIDFLYKYFQFNVEVGKSDPSKWNKLLKKWEFYGFTSIHSDYISTLQMSGTYKISPNYEICYNVKNHCEAIEYLISDFHFIHPANFGYIGLKFFYDVFQFLVSAGYYQNTFLEQKDPIKKYESFQNLSYYLIEKKKDLKLEIIEPNLSIMINSNKIKANFTYSRLFKNDYESKKFRFVSHSILLSFLYHF